MSRTTTTVLLLMVMMATTRASMDFSIDTTWNNGSLPLDHTPVKLKLTGLPDGSLELGIEAPFFNDPPNPGGKPGLPFFGLWEYEVVEAFFLNNDEQYLEVEVCPWGQHIVLMLAGQRNTIRHSLPMQVTTQRTESTWTGTAIIPAEYLPKAVTMFNAYAIHGSGDDRIYESLYPAPSTAENPDFHALQYFQAIDLSIELPSQSSDPMSAFWLDALQGIFPYSITTDWKGVDLEQEPIKISIQGFEAGVELNVSAPFFNDPKPDAPQGPFMGLWDYEVVEMFFLNDNDEYLEVEVGPWGHHILLLLKGERNSIADSLELDYFANREDDTWTGSAMIPPSYFPPNVTRMNAYAIHGVGENRVYQALYPAPANSEAPDFHRLGLFEPLDFEYQVADNSEYSSVWEDAMNSAALRMDEETQQKEEELNIALTSMDPLIVTEITTEIPEEEGVTMLGFFDNLTEKEPEIASQDVGTIKADNKETEQTDKKESNMGLRPLTRRPSITPLPARRRPSTTQSPVQTPSLTRSPPRRPSIRRPSIRRPSIRQPSSESSTTEITTEIPAEEESRPSTTHSPVQTPSLTRSPARRPSIRRPSIRRPSIRQPSSESSTTEITTEIPAEEESTTLSFFDLSDEKEQEMTSQMDINQSDNRNTEQIEEKEEEDVNIRPLTRRPTIRRPSITRSPARSPSISRSPARRPNPVQIDNSQRPIQNRRLDDDRHSSGNFLPDQKFPTNVLRPTQFLRPVQRPVPQIVERPPQKEIIFKQEDEKLQIQSGEEQQKFNVQIEDQSQSLGGIVNDNTTMIPHIEENKDIIIQEENPQIGSLIPLVPLPHPVCREAGLLPDRLRCMVFHECVIENGQWQLYSWRCKRGHYYDPHTVSCQRGRCNL